jgi:hypothetical protein
MSDPRVLAYGEDPLTLWALTQRLSLVLRQLDDETPPANVLVVYRPSFGRGGASKRSRAGRRAEFGEFDAIVQSSRSTYLVEAKWHRSGEIQDGVVVLRPEQIERHRILRWLLQSWRRIRPTSWAEFRRQALSDFEAEFPRMTLAPDGSRLASSLEYLMGPLSRGPETIRDVLLITCPKGVRLDLREVPAGFTSVTIPFDPVVASTDYFCLQ